MLLDTTYDIATPEGVELRLPLAGLAARSLAWLVDAGIKAVVLFTASILLGGFGGFGVGLLLLIAFVLMWLYNVLFEVLRHGATPGKRYFDIAVTNLDGTPVGWSGSVIRNLIRAVDVLPGCYAFGCVSVLVSGKFQRLGDLAAGTVVVHRPTRPAPRRRAQSVDAPAGGAPAGDAPERDAPPVDVPLSREEQQAIVDFRERAAALHAERAEELAAILAPVLGRVDAPRLRAHGSWLAGRDRRW